MKKLFLFLVSLTASIFAMTLSTKVKGNGASISFPDVCKTPTTSGPGPIPYPNISSGNSGGGKKRK